METAQDARLEHGFRMHGLTFDGKRMRKQPIVRRTVDYNSDAVNYVERRVFQRDVRDRPALIAEPSYIRDLLLPSAFKDNPVTSIATRFVHTSTNKIRCPINVVAWTPEGRRLITGASSGEFTLWNGLTFNFETILQAHDYPVRAMVWSHNENWMVTGDHGGFIKYWQSNMNNVKAFPGHRESVRDIRFCPTDFKFASCSDDGNLKIWDFEKCKDEKVLTGHGWDVKCVDWHPQKAIIVSGSKDNLIKLWDPKTGKNLTTLHGHKNTVVKVTWNRNGNWLLTGARDHLIKVYDIRTMREIRTFRGHKREVTALSWHPYHEDLFASGGFDGSILFWLVGEEAPQAEVGGAHDSSVWDLAWHPLGHILCSGSNDHTTKFWCRNRPGDSMRDRYNIAQAQAAAAASGHAPLGPYGYSDSGAGDQASGASTVIPGMGSVWGGSDFEDDVDADVNSPSPTSSPQPSPQATIPGWGAQSGGPGAVTSGGGASDARGAMDGRHDASHFIGTKRPYPGADGSSSSFAGNKSDPTASRPAGLSTPPLPEHAYAAGSASTSWHDSAGPSHSGALQHGAPGGSGPPQHGLLPPPHSGSQGPGPGFAASGSAYGSAPSHQYMQGPPGMHMGPHGHASGGPGSAQPMYQGDQHMGQGSVGAPPSWGGRGPGLQPPLPSGAPPPQQRGQPYYNPNPRDQHHQQQSGYQRQHGGATPMPPGPGSAHPYGNHPNQGQGGMRGRGRGGHHYH